MATLSIAVAVTASTALAANLSGDGTFIGTTGADTIAAGNMNDTVWGLGGGDTISAGNGNDMIDADGSCPPGVQMGHDYTGTGGNNFPPGQYCNHGHHGHHNATISAGNGNDTIYGGGGHNTISVGGGNNVTVVGGPLGDTISIGSGGTPSQPNVIYLDVRDSNDTCGTACNYTGSTVSVGGGTAIVSAYNGVKDTISCPTGKNNDTVYADKSDVIKGKCFQVLYKQGPTLTPPLPARDRKAIRRASTHKRQHKLHPSHKQTTRRSKTT